MLRAEAEALTRYLREHPTVPPQRIADMLFRTRKPRRYRALAMVTSHGQLTEALTAVAEDLAHPAVIRGEEPAQACRTAYVLPGQGGQRPGMGALFHRSMPAYRAEVDRCDAIFRARFGDSPLGYLLGTDDAGDSTTVVQSALFMQMVGLGAVWRSWGVAPGVVVGHSQGEIAGAYLADKMSLEDAALVVGTRARAAESISSDAYAMAVVGADRDECEGVLARQNGWAEVSVVNSPRMVGISGERETVAAVVDTLAGRGRFTRTIPVRYPAHTNAVNEFRDVIAGAARGLSNPDFLDGASVFIGATLGEQVPSGLAVADYWFWNLRNTVRFDRAVAAAVADGVDVFIELAEHPTLQYAIEENLAAAGAANRTVLGTSDRDATDPAEFTRSLAVLAVHDIDYDWTALRTESGHDVTLPLLDFPNTQMNELSLWLPYHGFLARRADPDDRPDPAPQTRPVTTAPPRILTEEWRPVTRRSVTPPRRIGIIDHTGDCAELARALCAHAERQELSARLITAGDDTDQLDAVVILQPAAGPVDADEEVRRTATFFADRTWWRAPGAGLGEYWLLTVGAERVRPGDHPADPVSAALAAGFRCLGAQYPDIAFRHLDLSPAQPDPVAIIAALHTTGEPELALRDGGLYTKRLVDAPSDPDAPALTGRHVLITGGTGRVGLEFAEYAARAGAGRVTLVSRSGTSPGIAERLRGLPATADIRVLACDVTDAAAVAELAAGIDAPVDLLVHAVLDTDGTGNADLEDLTADRLERGLRGKIVGLSHALQSVPLSDDARILLCSSTASVLGGRGKLVYAAANRLLDAHAQLLRDQGRDCVSVQWGQWDVFEGRDRAEAANLAEIGYLTMRSAEAVELGLRRLPANVAIAALDLDRARSGLGLLGYGPTLSALAAIPTADIPAARTTGAAERVESGHDGTDVRRRLLGLLAEVLGVDDVQAVDGAQPLVAVGLDSLNALQLRRRIKSEFRCEVAVSKLLGGATLDDVVREVGDGAAADASGAARRPAEPAPPDGRLELARIPSARADLDLFGLAAMWRVLEPVLGDGDTHDMAELTDRLRIVERHHWILRQWLEALTTRGFVGAESGGYRRLRPVPAPQRPDLTAVCTDLGYPPPFGEFLAAANEHLERLLTDRTSVQELLFPDGSTATADAFYRDNVISRYLNRRARQTVADTVRGLMTERSPVRVLELGAGVGGMTDAIVDGLAGLPVEYHFTDVSTFFLTAAQKRFAAHPWMTFGLVDLNSDLGRQPPCDVVIAANVVHNAADIGRTLDELHGILRPGGAIVLIELCTAHCSLMTSVYFLMSPRPGLAQVGLTDVRAGTDRILLTRDEWHGEFARAGFTPMAPLPPADDPLAALDQFVLGAVRRP
ncbi:nocobactin polyketide synthase NbtC [Mycobacterium sp. NPDC003449]